MLLYMKVTCAIFQAINPIQEVSYLALREVKVSVDSSSGWKQIPALREKIRPHICKKVGNGEKKFLLA